MKFKQDILWYKNDYLKQGWEMIKSPHYIFYYLKDSLAEKDIQFITELKEKQYEKITNWLGVNNDRIIDYYLYNSIQEKTDLMGDDRRANLASIKRRFRAFTSCSIL